MDSRLLDVIIGCACFVVLIIMLALLPMAMPASPGLAYLAAILIFMLALFGAGYFVNKQIV